MGDGIKSGLGVLSAFRDALEETIQEARDRGDLSAERAKEAVKEALNRAQQAASDARERLDFAQQTEFDALVEAVASLRRRVEALEQASSGDTASDPPGEGRREGAQGA
jgi:polyhydroxyalkanoate synthesis regulator phasin